MPKTPDEIRKGLDWDEVDKSLQKVRFTDDNESDARKPKPAVDIKTALEVCKYGCQQCYRCGYENIMSGDEENDEICEDALKTDALELIHQLEAENARMKSERDEIKRKAGEVARMIAEYRIMRESKKGG